MKYKIAKAKTAEGLTRAVNKLLASGWKCQGGVSTNVFFDDYQESNEFFFAQAMVK